MAIWIKQHQSSIQEKVKHHWGWVEKNGYRKSVYLQSNY